MAREKKIKEVIEGSETYTEDMSRTIAGNLNKRFKEQKIAYFLGEDIDTPANVKAWVSTGNDIMDLTISNRKHGGMPTGRIIEITGLEACVTEDTIVDIIVE